MIKDAGRKQVEAISVTEDDLKEYMMRYSVALESVANSVTSKH